MKKFIGEVVSNKMDKTVVVRIGRIVVHPLYGKRMKRHKRIKVHCEKKLNLGDKVEIVETRPLSKEKHFKVVKVL